MRVLAAASLALLLVASAMPAEAHPSHPFPKTEKATRALVKDVLEDTDQTGAQMLREARQMLRALKGTVADALPTVPDTTQGALEVRATLVQPGVRGEDMVLGALWLGSSRAYWTGVYWAESDGAGNVRPNLADINEDGLILIVEGGALALGSSVNITYHFLGLDGKHVVHRLGRADIFESMPRLDRLDVGGAHLSTREHGFNAVLLSPWSLYGHNITAGISVVRGEDVLVEETITACADWEVEAMEPGCRLLYAFAVPDDATSIRLWSIGEDGARKLERELPRDELECGVTFAP